jgi:hypothetical protein
VPVDVAFALAKALVVALRGKDLVDVGDSAAGAVKVGHFRSPFRRRIRRQNLYAPFRQRRKQKN